MLGLVVQDLQPPIGPVPEHLGEDEELMAVLAVLVEELVEELLEEELLEELLEALGKMSVDVY